MPASCFSWDQFLNVSFWISLCKIWRTHQLVCVVLFKAASILFLHVEAVVMIFLRHVLSVSFIILPFVLPEVGWSYTDVCRGVELTAQMEACTHCGVTYPVRFLLQVSVALLHEERHGSMVGKSYFCNSIKILPLILLKNTIFKTLKGT